MPEAACWHFDTHNAMNRWFFRDSLGGSAFFHERNPRQARSGSASAGAEAARACAAALVLATLEFSVPSGRFLFGVNRLF
jgi:hypothetical protein